MSRIVTTLGCVWVFAWTVGVAQQPAPVFEAATIKKTAGDTPGASFRYFPGGRFVMTNAPIRGLILSAFPTETGEMIGAPDWIETDRYDVNAKAEGDPPQETMRLMLQSLLRDRLRLRARYEERERDVYFLNVARPGEPGALKLKRSQLDCAAIQKSPQERRPRLWNARLRNTIRGTWSVARSACQQFAESRRQGRDRSHRADGRVRVPS